MVLKKRLDYGINGFLVPTIPRGPRSVRGKRGPLKKRIEDENCAFELLASLAGKLLLESESSASSNASQENYRPDGRDIKQERFEEYKPSQVECIDQQSCRNSIGFSDHTSKKTDRKRKLKEFSHADGDSVLELTSVVTNSKNHIQSPMDSKEFHVESRAVVNSDSDIKLPPARDVISVASDSRTSNNIKSGSFDDDEHFSEGHKPSSKFNSSRPPSRIADRRIRRLLSSEYWKIAPKLKDCEISRSASIDGGIKSFHRKRKTFHDHERCQRNASFKRKRCFDRSSMVSAYGGLSSESVSNSPEKGMSRDRSATAAISQSSHVKFSINSFKVPELFVEVPESATVGMLKRTVMEAVTAILGGGLHVGVLLHGKKVRNDNITLSQSGLSDKDNFDTLGFTLEPNHVQAPTTMCSVDPPQLPQDTSQLLTRSPKRSLEMPTLNLGISDGLPDTLPTNSENHDLINHESISFHNDMSKEEPSPNSKAPVAVQDISTKPLAAIPANQATPPEMNTSALAVVPVNQKNKCPELVHRRTRRPFSVFEVEALVQSVEELGTGRWRDVKLRSFENADHRTYVDLKDKWKTLVHTAKISPQQRRGEPVPQELLDRVLAAHAYWSQHQAKQHGKQQQGTTKITESPTDRLGVEVLQLL